MNAKALPTGPQRARSEIDARIGPVRHEYGPRWAFRLTIYLGIIPLYFLAFVVLTCVITGLLMLVEFIPRQAHAAGPMLLVSAFLGGIDAFGFFMLWPRYRLLGSRLILGEGGVAEWTPYGTDIVTAENLGTEWVWRRLGPDNDGIPYYIYLALQHVPTGRKLYITNFYRNAGSIAQLLRQKLADRIQTARWSDLSHWRPRPESELPSTHLRTPPNEPAPPVLPNDGLTPG